MKYLTILILMLLTLTTFPQTKPNPKLIKTVDSKAIPQKYIMTSYCINGRTASGERVRPGIVAADLRILPLGTALFIEGYGNFIVKDSGSAVTGKHLDFWQKSCTNAIRFGRKSVNVTKIV